MDVKFNDSADYFNFYKEGTKLVWSRCSLHRIVTDGIVVNDLKIGTSMGVYIFDFNARQYYDGFSVKCNGITPYIILDNTISSVGSSAFITHGSPHIFNTLSRLKISGVSEVNTSLLLGDYIYNAKIVYDNPVASINDIRCKVDYYLSIIIYWDKNGRLHFAPYHSNYSSFSSLDPINYRGFVRNLLRVERPESWDDGAYLLYKAIIDNFDISGVWYETI